MDHNRALTNREKKSIDLDRYTEEIKLIELSDSLSSALKRLDNFLKNIEQDPDVRFFIGYLQESKENADCLKYNSKESICSVNLKIYQWREKLDVCPVTLYHFLKILTLYDPHAFLDTNSISGTGKCPISRQQSGVQGIVRLYLGELIVTGSEKKTLTVQIIASLIRRFILLIMSVMTEFSGTEMISSAESLGLYKNKKLNKDADALCPLVRMEWKNLIQNCRYPFQIGQETVAENVIANLPKTISLYAKDPMTVARKVAKATDPRIYEKGNYKGLKPHLMQP